MALWRAVMPSSLGWLGSVIYGKHFARVSWTVVNYVTRASAHCKRSFVLYLPKPPSTKLLKWKSMLFYWMSNFHGNGFLRVEDAGSRWRRECWFSKPSPREGELNIKYFSVLLKVYNREHQLWMLHFTGLSLCGLKEFRSFYPINFIYGDYWWKLKKSWNTFIYKFKVENKGNTPDLETYFCLNVDFKCCLRLQGLCNSLLYDEGHEYF